MREKSKSHADSCLGQGPTARRDSAADERVPAARGTPTYPNTFQSDPHAHYETQPKFYNNADKNNLIAARPDMRPHDGHGGPTPARARLYCVGRRRGLAAGIAIAHKPNSTSHTAATHCCISTDIIRILPFSRKRT